MKKLAIYSSLLVTLFAVTACETKTNTTTHTPPNQTTRERTTTTTTPQNPNQPTRSDQDQIQR